MLSFAVRLAPRGKFSGARFGRRTTHGNDCATRDDFHPHSDKCEHFQGIRRTEKRLPGLCCRELTGGKEERTLQGYNCSNLAAEEALSGTFMVGEWRVLPGLNSLERAGRTVLESVDAGVEFGILVIPAKILAAE